MLQKLERMLYSAVHARETTLMHGRIAHCLGIHDGLQYYRDCRSVTAETGARYDVHPLQEMNVTATKRQLTVVASVCSTPILRDCGERAVRVALVVVILLRRLATTRPKIKIAKDGG